MWLVQGAIVTVKLRNRMGSAMFVFEVESNKMICAGLDAKRVRYSFQSVFLCEDQGKQAPYL